MKMNHNQAPGGNARPNKNEYKGKPAKLHKAASAKPATGMNSHKRGRQGH